MSQLGEKIAIGLRRSVFKKLLYLDAGFYEHHLTGDLLSRLIHDTSVIQSFLVNAFPVLLRNAVIAIGGVTLLYYNNLKLALIMSFCFPLVVIPLFVFDQVVRLNKKKGKKALIHLVHAPRKFYYQLKLCKPLTKSCLKLKGLMKN